MSFFKPMRSVWYDVPGGETILINDITVFADFPSVWKKNAQLQLPYIIKDGELPHMLSNRLYGSVDYWWTILKVNGIYDFNNQWPRSSEQLNIYIQNKYPGKTFNDVHHYVNPNGLVADLISLRLYLNLTSDSQVINQAGLEAISIGDFETALNDDKRNIVLIDPDYIGSVQSEYEKSLEATGL